VQRLLPMAGDVSTQGADHFAVIPPTIRFRSGCLVTKEVPTLDSDIGGHGALATLATVATGQQGNMATGQQGNRAKKYIRVLPQLSRLGRRLDMLSLTGLSYNDPQLSLSAPVCWTPIV
jgi:hypothetical protein